MNLSLNQNTNFSNQRIAELAFTWLETPFKKYGRIKYVGVDCIGFILGVLKEINHPSINKIQDNLEYNFKKNNSLLREVLKANFEQITDIYTPSIALLNYQNEYQHLGIIVENSDALRIIIHADISAKKVVAHRLDSVMQKRIQSIYKI